MTEPGTGHTKDKADQNAGNGTGNGAGGGDDSAGRPAGAPRRRGRFGLFVFTLLLLAAAAGTGWFLRDRLAGTLPDVLGAEPAAVELARRVAALDGRLEVVESQVADLAAHASPAGDPTGASGDTAARLAQLEAQVAAIQAGGQADATAGPDDALARRLADMEQRLTVLGERTARSERVAALEGRTTALADRLEAATAESRQRLATLAETQNNRVPPANGPLALRAAFAVATARLERAVRDGRPYDEAWRTARDLALAMAAGGDIAAGTGGVTGAAGVTGTGGGAPPTAMGDSLAALAVLERTAASGAPDAAELSNDLNAMARDMLAAARGANADGVLARVWARLRGLVSIRRQDGPPDASGIAEGAPPEALLAAAEEGLRNGDLAAAITAVERLHRAAGGAQTGAAADWLARAGARADALAAADRLDRAALAALAAAALAGGLPAPPVGQQQAP